jgi:hypothetical protein
MMLEAVLQAQLLKPFPSQLIANRLHTVFEGAIAGKNQAAFFHHANRRRQAGQGVGNDYVYIGMAKCPANQGANGLSAIAVPRPEQPCCRQLAWN